MQVKEVIVFDQDNLTGKAWWRRLKSRIHSTLFSPSPEKDNRYSLQLSGTSLNHSRSRLPSVSAIFLRKSYKLDEGADLDNLSVTFGVRNVPITESKTDPFHGEKRLSPICWKSNSKGR
ncbi:hypothetical protein Dimus_012610 [Dionaea muscipula]